MTSGADGDKRSRIATTTGGQCALSSGPTRERRHTASSGHGDNHSMAFRFLWHHTAFRRSPEHIERTWRPSSSPVRAVSLLSISDLIHGTIPMEWLILASLTVVSGSVPIRLYSIPVALSVSETFVFMSVILFGPSAGTLTVVLDAAVISFWSFKRGQKLFKVVFNVCALPLTIWLAAHLLFAVGRFEPALRQHRLDRPSKAS